MSDLRYRRAVLALCASAAGLGAGCLDGSPTDGGADDAGDDATQPDDATTEPPTVSPSEVSDGAAKERALAAEEEFLTARLENASCLNDWGTTPSTVSESAEVVDRSAEGVTVSVTHPYWYSTGNEEADLASDAVYVVTADEVRRTGGTNVSPC